MECEYHPLLWQEPNEDVSIVSKKRNWLSGQRYNMVTKGRANKKLQGAAQLMSQWPVHASTAVAYFWLGVASFIAAVFILYAILFRMAAEDSFLNKISTATHSVTRRAITLDTSYKNAFMHIILRDISDFNSLDFKDPIHNLTNSFKDFNFTLYLMLEEPINKTPKRNYPTNHENNIEAIHEILSSRPINKYTELETPNFKVVETSVEKYCNDASLSNILLRTNTSLLPFIIRTISIWENGGIAFDPYILLYDNISLHKNYTKSKSGLYETFNTMDNNYLYSENTPVLRNNSPNENKTKSIFVESNVRDIKKFEGLVTKDNDTNITESSKADITESHKLRQSVFLKKVLCLLNYFSKNEPPDEIGKDNNTHDISDEISNEKYNLEDLKRYENLRRTVGAKSYNEDQGHISLNDTPVRSLPELVQNIEAHIQETVFIESRGLFLATKAQCHPFIGVIFTTISTKDVSVKDFIKNRVSYYCKDDAICPSIRLV